MAKDVVKRLHEEWMRCFERLRQGEFFRLLAAGQLDARHYAGFLRETYHNVARNPKNMALFISHLGGRRPDLQAKLLKHAAMEVGHDQLALDDLEKLGFSPDEARKAYPLPTTEAMTAFIVFQIQFRNPVAYLGYLYHLEALPVHFGSHASEGLARIGVPPEACSFLREHAEADPIHLKWNREYLEGFIEGEADMEAALYGLRGTCRLHEGMFQGILESAADLDPAKARRAA